MLNPDLNIPQLADEFRQKRRIQIRTVLNPQFADRLYECLHHKTPWGTAFIDGERSTIIEADKVARLTVAERAALSDKVAIRAADGFQFLYNSYMMITAYMERRNPDSMLHAMVDFINAPMFLGLMRSVTGIPNILKADAQATRYLPGHFLKRHNDVAANQSREMAYVLNLTRDWQADWGGLLQFLGDDGEVTDTFFPSFNSLVLFQVPMWHHVSYVAPFAAQPRYAITGWGMSRPPTA